VVLLFDVPLSSLAPAQLAALNELVVDRGGSVIVVAGDANALAGYATNPTTQGWLPFAAGAAVPPWRIWPGERPAVRVVPSPYGGRIDALRLGDDADTSDRAWQQLPPLY